MFHHDNDNVIVNVNVMLMILIMLITPSTFHHVKENVYKQSEHLNEVQAKSNVLYKRYIKQSQKF